MSKINIDDLLANQALFQHISPFGLDSLKRSVVKVELEKAQTLFQKGDLADGCYVLVFGIIKLAIPSSAGSDKIIELIRPGQCFGEAMLFLDEPYPFYAEALESSLLLRLPKNALFSLLEQSPVIAKQMMRGLSYRLLGFIRNLERHASHNAMQRVVDYLVQVSVSQNDTRIRLELKKNVVASFLNLTPETFSRTLHQLSEQGVIQVHGSHIHIHCLESLKNCPTDVPVPVSRTKKNMQQDRNDLGMAYAASSSFG